VMASNGVIHIIDSVISFEAKGPGTVVDVATGAGVFTTLLTAATAAGLVETLSNPDATLTVFAPPDSAFVGVDVAALVADAEGLKTLLLNHVLLSEVLSSDLSDGQVVTMAGGSDVTVMIADGKVMINNAEVVQADVMASNGVIHILDAILDFSDSGGCYSGSPNHQCGCSAETCSRDLCEATGQIWNNGCPEFCNCDDYVVVPEPVVDVVEEGPGTIVAVATANGSFGTLLAAATAAGLVDTLNNPDATLTVFAPTDEAFKEVDVAALLLDTDALKTILLNHVFGSVVMSSDLSNGQEVDMLGGGKLTVKIADGTVMVNNAKVVIPDVKASNGVIHVVDSVITFEKEKDEMKDPEKEKEPEVEKETEVEEPEDESSVKAFSLAPVVFTAMISMIVV